MRPLYHRIVASIAGLAILFGLGGLLTACDSDDATATPTAFTSPVDGKQYCAWMNNPHECDSSGLPAAPFAMPQSQPVQQPGMSNVDYALLGGLFGYYMGHHSYYNRPWYYDNYIGPAWTRYPSGNFYAYPGRTVTRITTVNNYTTIVHNVDTKYAAQEKSFSSNPKYSTYKTANGKTYTGTTVPKKAFSGTNVPVNKAPLGNANYSNNQVKSPTNSVTKPSTSTNTGNSKSGYGKSFSGSSPSSGGGSWFSGNYRSKGGRK